jgi:hypothetical protein
MRTTWMLGVIVLVLFLTVLLDTRASASSVFASGSTGAYYLVGHFGFGGDQYVRTGNPGTGGGVFFNDAGTSIPGLSITGQADSYGGAGFVRAHSFAQMIRNTSVPEQDMYGVGVNSGGSVNVTYSDVVVSGPAGGVVQTRLNLHIDGSFISGTTVGPFENGTHVPTAANDFVAISVAVDSNAVASGNYYYASVDGSPPAEIESLSTGVLINFNGNLDFQSNDFYVQSGVPFTVQFQLQTAASVLGPANRGLIVDANTEFSNTFSFATDRPVFSLPDGFTANSSDAGIVNNNFSVPEPGSLLLLAGGLAAVLLVRSDIVRRLTLILALALVLNFVTARSTFAAILASGGGGPSTTTTYNGDRLDGFTIQEDVARDSGAGPWQTELVNTGAGPGNMLASGVPAAIDETFNNVGSVPWTGWHDGVLSTTTVDNDPDYPGFLFRNGSLNVYHNGALLAEGSDYVLTAELVTGQLSTDGDWDALTIFFNSGTLIQPGDSLRITKDIFEVFGDGNTWQVGEAAVLAQYPTVPEPASVSLALVGGVCAAAWRQRRGRRRN